MVEEVMKTVEEVEEMEEVEEVRQQQDSEDVTKGPPFIFYSLRFRYLSIM